MATPDCKSKQAPSTKANLSVRLAALASVACYLIASAAVDVAWAAPRQCLFSLSTRRECCRALGITGIPAYVVFKDASRRGVYITSVSKTGMMMWSLWGLAPGDVLMEINGRATDSTRACNSILNSLKPGDITISFAEIEDNVPHLYRKRVKWAYVDGLDIPDEPQAPSTTGKPASFKEESVSSLELHMLQLVNDDRRRNGAMPVSQDSSLTSLARDYAEYMLKRGFFAHVDPDGRSPGDRARARGISGVCENISFEGGRGMQSDRDLVTSSQAKMMAEPPNQQNHRSNIIDPGHHAVGIGIARNKSTVMMVQEFN